MVVLVVIGIVVFLGYSALVLIDARGWGLPRVEREQRLWCRIGDCRASFVCRFEDWNAAAKVVEMHQRAAHQDDDSPQLWPTALPPRRRDFTTRQARLVQDLDSEDPGVVVVNGVRVKVYRGGKSDARTASRAK